jgi:hypothetical protein
MALIWIIGWRVEYKMQVGSISIGGHAYDTGMQWSRRGQGQWTLIHGFIFKANTSGGYEAACNWHDKSTGSHNSHKAAQGYIHVLMTPDGLYANRNRLTPTSDSRIFILSLPDKSDPLKLTPREMAMFHPDVYPFVLEGADLWRSKILPLVDPAVIAYQQRLADEAAEQTQFEALGSLGIYRTTVHGLESGDLIYHADFYEYPNGTSMLANAIFASQAQIRYTSHSTDLQRPVHESDKIKFPLDFHGVYVEPFPSFYMFNGKKVERNKVFAFRKDGTTSPLDLTEDEYRQLTSKLFKSPEKLKATEIYRKKIAPAIGAPVEVE